MIGNGERLGYQEFNDVDLNTVLAESEIDLESVNPFARALTKVYYKRSFLFVYGFLTTVTLSLIIYDFTLRDDGFKREKGYAPWFIALDVACVLFLVLELIVRLSVRRDTLAEFWTNPKNALDLLVVILCILTLFPYAYNLPQSRQLVISTLILRYAAQIIRLIFFLIRLRTQHLSIRSIEDTSIDLHGMLDKDSISFGSEFGLKREFRIDSWSLMEDSGSNPNQVNIFHVTPENLSKIPETAMHTPTSTLCTPRSISRKQVRANSISVETCESVICVV